MPFPSSAVVGGTITNQTRKDSTVNNQSQTSQAATESRGVKSNTPNNVFVYSSYWRTWSRVLKPRTRDSFQVEVNLTPANPTVPASWSQVRDIVFREHCTARDANDRYLERLPDSVIADMRLHVDEATIERLLHEDFLPQIDWVLYSQHDNGGCPLRLCQK